MEVAQTGTNSIFHQRKMLEPMPNQDQQICIQASNFLYEVQGRRTREIPFPLIEWAWSPELEIKIPCRTQSTVTYKLLTPCKDHASL